MVALVLLGGTGLIVYAAALVLVSSDGELAPSAIDARDRAIAVTVAIALGITGFALGIFGSPPGFGGALSAIALLALAGLAVWGFVSGQRPAGRPGELVRRAAIGIASLAGCFALAVGSFFASGFGGGVVVASLVIPARWPR